MSDIGHDMTDGVLDDLEKRIAREYAQAYREVEKKAADYFARFAAKDKQKQALVKSGKLTEKEYKEWRRNQMLTGKRWTDLRDTLAKDLTNTNKIAAAMVRGELNGVFAINANYSEYLIENGMRTNYGFTLYDRDTVANLIKNDPDIIPWKPSVDIPADLRWNRQMITSHITQGILQGESIPNLSKRLLKTVNNNKVAAVRTARTAVTSSQNAGRQMVYDKAQAMGIKLQKEWLATLDGRTRHEHGAVDGQRVDLDKPFNVGGYKMMYPADMSAPAHLTMNCRCTTITVEPPHITKGEEPRKTYDEWIAEKGGKEYEKYQGKKAVTEKPKTMNRHYEPLSETEEKIDFISKELGVSREVAAQYNLAVAQYGGMSFGKIREASYIGGSKFDEVVFAGKYKSTYNEMAENIEQFIQRSPKWSSDIYRGANIPKSVLNGYKNGDVIDMMGVSSWTSNIDVADSYTYKTMDPRTIFHSNGTKQGTSIKHLAHYTQEDEVIISSKARWQIEKIEQIEDVTHIYVKELELELG